MQKDERFKVSEFTNPSGAIAYRVQGTKYNGERVRENFKTRAEAVGRQGELEGEHHNIVVSVKPQLTALSDEKLRVAEAAFLKLPDPAELLLAVDYWLSHGRKRNSVVAPKVSEAVVEFAAWVDSTSELRDATKPGLLRRVNRFAADYGAARIPDIDRDMVFTHVSTLPGTPVNQDNSRRAISRFFAWCGDQQRRWTLSNPAHGVTVPGLKAHKEQRAITILSVNECEELMHAAEAFEKGRLVPYTAVCLFGGLRPFEAQRLSWDQVNLEDGEIRIEAAQSKVKRARTVTINPTLRAWLAAYKGKPFFPSNWRKDFDKIKVAIGYGTPTKTDPKLKPWTPDITRHTAISHMFRKSGSYGLTAEQSGNSEGIIKRFYQGQVSSGDTKAFYAILPKPPRAKRKPGRKQKAPANVVAMRAA